MLTKQQSIIEIWQKVDSYLCDKLGRVSYSTFNKAVKPISFLNNTLILGVPNNFMRKWVMDKCEFYIKKAVKTAFDLDIIIEINII